MDLNGYKGSQSYDKEKMVIKNIKYIIYIKCILYPLTEL